MQKISHSIILQLSQTEFLSMQSITWHTLTTCVFVRHKACTVQLLLYNLPPYCGFNTNTINTYHLLHITLYTHFVVSSWSQAMNQTHCYHLILCIKQSSTIKIRSGEILSYICSM